MHLFMYVYCTSPWFLRRSEEGVDPLGLDLGPFVNHGVVLGIQPKFSAEQFMLSEPTEPALQFLRCIFSALKKFLICDRSQQRSYR